MVRLSTTVRSLFLTLGMSAALWAALILFAHAEVIRDFDVTLMVEENSDLTVIEKITYDFERAQRHGIFREVKNIHRQPASAWYKTRQLELTPISVTRNGQSEPFVNEKRGDMYLRIGDADTTISGEHTYEITYIVRGALSVYPEENLTEVYWNVTGDEWEVSIENVSVAVVSAGQVKLTEQAACYTGVRGSTNVCSSLEQQPDKTVFSQTNLSPGSQLTIVQSVQLPQPATLVESIIWIPFVFGGIVSWLLGIAVYVIRWVRAHRFTQSIIAQYEPYKDFKPMFTGVLIDSRLDARDISAGLVHLAQQGFISIKQTEHKLLGLFTTHDHEITLKRPITEAGLRFEQGLLWLIFKGQPAMSTEKGFNPFRQLMATSTALYDPTDVGKTVRVSEIKRNQPKLRANYKLLQSLRKSAKEDLVQLGFLQQRVKDFSYQNATRALLVPIVVFVGVLVGFGGFGYALVALIGFTLPLIFTIFMERRTRKGYEARYHLQGFKDFLSTTEKERYKFHNAPAKNPEQFMQYLPYAIAFGVEKEWAEVFKDLQIAAPEWYSTNTPGATFSAGDFASELGGFSTAMASSGTSGSPGGGSSGGGSGGGGGGSW